MSNKNLISAILGGAAIGAAVGLLLAPQSGKETRQKIRKVGNMSAEQLNELVAQGKNSWYEVKGKAKESAGVAADELDDFIGHILQSGKKWWKSAKNKANDMADDAEEAVDRAGDKVNKMAERGADMAKNAGDQARNIGNRAENAVNAGVDQAKRTANEVKDRIS